MALRKRTSSLVSSFPNYIFLIPCKCFQTFSILVFGVSVCALTLHYQKFDCISVGQLLGTKDVESLRTFVLEETEKAAAAASAQLDDDKDL